MAQITIDIPDDLAQRLTPFQNQFSELFTRLIASPLLEQNSTSKSSSDNFLVDDSGTYREILDFLISRPTSEQIIGFKVSESSQSRLQTLLQKNQEDSIAPLTCGINAIESAELELYEQLDALMGLLKIRAYTANVSK